MSAGIKVRFLVTDFPGDPDEVSARLGIQPSHTWRSGDLTGRSIRRHKENGWRLDASGAPDASLSDQVSELIAKLTAVEGELLEIARGCHLELSCVFYLRDSAPEMHFEKETIRWLAGVSADIDIDVYVVGEDDSELDEALPFT